MADTVDLVVLGAWYGTGRKGGMKSIFLMGCYDEDNDIWLTVTKVHSGHDDDTLAKLQDQLKDMIKISKDPYLLPKWIKANNRMIPDFIAKDPKVIFIFKNNKYILIYIYIINYFSGTTSLGNNWC